jgi:hypothetical protein
VEWEAALAAWEAAIWAELLVAKEASVEDINLKSL